MGMLKSAVKGLAGTLGYDVIRRSAGRSAELTRGIVARFHRLGDAALAGILAISMIKIDTGAMELLALAGLAATLARHRPKLFIEVDDTNQADFEAFARAHGYAIAATHRRYATNCNYLLEPRR